MATIVAIVVITMVVVAVTLLDNRILTSVIFYFQHRLLTNVETTNIKSINVNINFYKTEIDIHYSTLVFKKTNVV